MNSYHPWTTDNRFGPGNSGASAPANAPAAYSARWIDMGDDRLADVVPDRQGFGYNDKADMERLIEAMGKAGDALRTPYKVNLAHDETRIVMNTPDWECYMRRAGGYIYVDAWLTPAIAKPRERTWEVVCIDDEIRHEGTFATQAEAQEWADMGHVCVVGHKYVEVWS